MTSIDHSTTSEPYTLYLLWMSYFSGKMQAYLGYKEIPHRCIEPRWRDTATTIYSNTGLMKVPVVKTPQGQWLADSTPMIDWFEDAAAPGRVIPEDPYQAFFSRLLEDYADEWMWRPALYYRWAFAEDALSASHRFATTFLRDPIAPVALIALLARRRQYRLYVAGDGVTPDTRAHVEQTYLQTLDQLQAILSVQPFLLGDKPSLADFGFFASMFRHFSQDPTPARIMHERAPAVYAWLGRLWSARCSTTSGEWVAAGTLPQGWLPILETVGQTYLPYLHANAAAWKDGRSSFDVEIQGVRYLSLPVVQYRVWCREVLQRHHSTLPQAERARVDETLASSGCLEPLLRDGVIESRLHDSSSPAVCHPRKLSFGQKLSGYIFGTHWHTPKAFTQR